MTWEELTVNEDLLKGFAEQMMMDRVLRRFDETLVTDSAVHAAKVLVRTKLMASPIARHVAGYGTQAAFLDALAASGDLTDALDEMLAYAFLHNYSARVRNDDTDRLHTDAQRFLDKLDESVRAFAQMAPFALGLMPRTRPTGGGAIYSTMSTYGWDGR